MFTRPDGTPINPNYATTRFRKLTSRAGLPPVGLHALRHGAASLAHQAGADLKTLQDLLGHSSIVVTADTYTSVLSQAQRRCADAAAALVLAAARRTGEKIKSKGRKSRPQRAGNRCPHPTTPGAGTKGQVRAAKTSNNQRGIIAPSGHPSDAHRPHRPQTQNVRPAPPQVGRLTIWRARRDSNP